jgi:GT2 family glycosyltransferase
VTRLTVVTVAYGATPGLPEAVERSLASRGVDVDVVVVDNGSTDGTVDKVSSLDGVTVVSSGSNLGFGGGCNRGVDAATGELVGFVNPDVVVEPDALVRLADAVRDPDVGIASASVRLAEDELLLNSSGGAIHFLGLGWAEDFRRPFTVATVDRDVLAASGAAMVMRRDRFLELGGFTEELFLYHEDAELSLRCWMHGWRVRYVADAIVHHAYEFGRNPRKLQLLERNRLILVLTCYGRRMLVAVTPALLLYEVGITALSVAQGWFGEKAAGWRWLIRNQRWLRRRRRAVQAARRRSDRELAPLFAERFTGAQVALPAALAPADRLLAAYWRRVRSRV